MNTNSDPGGQPQGPIAKLVAVVLGVLTLVAAFMFSLVFLAVLAVGAVVVGGYFWWKTRALRRQMREQMQAQMDAMAEAEFAARTNDPPPGTAVIEGEAVRVVDEKDRLLH